MSKEAKALMLADLERSGLTEEDAGLLGLAAHGPSLVVPKSHYDIPYHDLDGKPTGHARKKLTEHWQKEDETKPRKYWQAAGTGSSFFFPKNWEDWGTVANDASIPVVFVEGEKKSACAAKHGFAAIGLAGVDNWRKDKRPITDFDLFVWPGRTVYIAHDSPDIYLNLGVTNAANALADELRRRGAIVKLVELPADSGEKVGLDDYLCTHGADAFRKLLACAVDRVGVVEKLNRRHALINVAGKALVLTETFTSNGVEIGLAKPFEVAPMYSNMLVKGWGDDGRKRFTAFDVWMSSPLRREYDRIVMEPNGEAPGEYNLFRGLVVKPAAGTCERILAHILEVIAAGKEDHYKYILTWSAKLVQSPGELPQTALVMRGGQGAGKSLFVQLLGSFFGSHYVPVSGTSGFLEGFNGHTKNAILLYADEAYWPGNKSLEGKLKTLITEPIRQIEHKGRDAFTIRNCVHLIMSSNSDWPVAAARDERRLAIFDVDNRYVGNREYFDALFAEIEAGGRAAFLEFLMKFDTSAVNLRDIPRTDALLDVKLRSLGSVEQFWYERLLSESDAAGSGWLPEVPFAGLYELYVQEARSQGVRYVLPKPQFGIKLKEMAPTMTHSRPRNPDGGQTRMMVVPPVTECREMFEKFIGHKIPWPPVADAGDPPVKPGKREKISGKR